MKTITITIPEDWHAAIKQLAASEGITVSALLAESGRARLPERIQATLSKAAKRGRPAKFPIDTK